MNTYQPIVPLIAAFMATFALCPAPLVFAQGSLTPPGVPAPTMKTLDQIELRTPISSLPLTITNPGSYYLTGNLTGAGGGLTIQANEVTLDLMGFTLTGGWTNGIDIPSARNSQLESLRVSGNSGYGIRVGTAISNHCEAFNNGAEGIEVNNSRLVTGNSCAGNGNGPNDGAGINAISSRNRIDSNNVMGNDRGIDCNPASTNLIIRNSARGNTTNYDIVGGNNFAAVIPGGMNFTNSTPWSNFEF